MMQVTAALAERFKTRFKEGDISECWLWEGFTSGGGYGAITWRNQCVPAHVISFSIYRYPVMKGMKIAHRCDNRNCVNPYHLKPIFEKVVQRKERHYNVLLKVEDVLKIRKLHEAGSGGVTAIARICGFSESTVRDVITGRTWKNV
jgi:hypothetical protein